MTYTGLANRFVPAKYHYPSRYGARPTHIGIHHIGGTQFAAAIEAWRNGSEAGSAHVAISNEGEIVAMVHEEYGAWSFSNQRADCFSLVMEIENQTGGPNWLISPEAMEAAAQVSADWRRRYGNLVMLGHNEFAARGWSYPTYCPGNHEDGSPGPEPERRLAIDARAYEINHPTAPLPKEDEMFNFYLIENPAGGLNGVSALLYEGGFAIFEAPYWRDRMMSRYKRTPPDDKSDNDLIHIAQDDISDELGRLNIPFDVFAAQAITGTGAWSRDEENTAKLDKIIAKLGIEEEEK